jgi:hypothetical protein
VTLSSSQQPVTYPTLVGAGLIRIVNGHGIAEVDLTFDGAARTYLPIVPLPPDRGIFIGGETLTISAAGGAAGAFTGAIVAPRPLTLTGPATLAIADDQDLPITWVPDDATQIGATLVASTSDGRWTLVSCTSADAAGRLVLPKALLAQLPPAPRDLQLQVSRAQLGTASGPGDTGVLLHAGYTVTVDTHQP